MAAVEVTRGWAEVSNPQPAGCMLPRMVMNAAQHKIVN